MLIVTGQTITAGSYNIVIGAGGDNDIGGNSTLSGYTALGGGNARAYTNDPSGIGTDGGCGGGGAGSVYYLWSGGTGSQGYNGGSGCLSSGGNLSVEVVAVAVKLDRMASKMYTLVVVVQDFHARYIQVLQFIIVVVAADLFGSHNGII